MKFSAQKCTRPDLAQGHSLQILNLDLIQIISKHIIIITIVITIHC